MKILVAVKRVVDPALNVQVKPDGSGVDLAGVKMAMNPFDEIAVEEALRLKGAGHASEVVVVSIGPQQATDTLRTALAMGADRAILVKTDAPVEPLGVAKLIRAVMVEEQPRLVILGKQAIDDDMNATGQMLAGLLGWPQATFTSRVAVQGETLEVTCEIDGGVQSLRVMLPALITTDLRLNTPRYASLPNIMKAKKKPVAETTPEMLGVEVSPRLLVVGMREASRRRSGRTVASATELARALKGEAGVL